MRSYEFNGKTVREAIKRACEELQVDEALLDIEVIQESARGFLGIVGQRDAVVRVRKRDILREVLEAEDTPPDSHDEPKPQQRPERARQETPPPKDVKVSAPPTANPSSREEIDLLDDSRLILEGILSRMAVETEVNAEMLDGAAYLDIKGDGSGLLIGKQGQTLDALQFLVNKIINKERPPGSKAEVIVDTERYRLRKREQFREKTLKKGAQAKRTLKPVSFPPMPANERRLVHMILADDREIFTKSVGEGSRRRIIVYPRRGTGSKRRR